MTRSYGMIDQQLIINGALRSIARTPSALGVLWVYAAHANFKTGEAFLAESTLARALGITLQAVQKARKMLKKYGLIIDTGRRINRCKIFKVMVTPQQAIALEEMYNPNDHTVVTPTFSQGNPNNHTLVTPTGVGTNRRKQKGTKLKQSAFQKFLENEKELEDWHGQGKENCFFLGRYMYWNFNTYQEEYDLIGWVIDNGIELHPERQDKIKRWGLAKCELVSYCWKFEDVAIERGPEDGYTVSCWIEWQELRYANGLRSDDARENYQTDTDDNPWWNVYEKEGGYALAKRACEEDQAEQNN